MLGGWFLSYTTCGRDEMTQYLPPNLLALFAPREPLPHVEPLDTLPWEKKPWPYAGVSQYLSLFEVRAERDTYPSSV